MKKFVSFRCKKCRVELPTAFRYRGDCDWCSPCVAEELERQSKERYAPQHPQIIEFRPEAE